MAHPEMIEVLCTTLKDWGLNEDMINSVDPYRWGGHAHRLVLWIARGNVRMVNPPDIGGQKRKFNDDDFWMEMGNIMRRLDSGLDTRFEERLKHIGLELVSYPPRVSNQ